MCLNLCLKLTGGDFSFKLCIYDKMNFILTFSLAKNCLEIVLLLRPNQCVGLHENLTKYSSCHGTNEIQQCLGTNLFIDSFVKK